MTDQSPNKEKILAQLAKELLSGVKVGEILNNPTEFPTRLIEELSLATALKYWNKQMTYSDGDCIMNNLYSYWMTTPFIPNDCRFSDIAWECYEAFDAGEFYRMSDDRNVDPSEKYTRPLVENLLKKLKQII